MIYSTHQPCLTCAKMIVNAGLVRIVYDAPYPDAVAERMLRDAAVELVRFPGGSVPQAAPGG